MNTAQHAFVREQFTQWVETTDVAAQCGLTRKEMIDSVRFGSTGRSGAFPEIPMEVPMPPTKPPRESQWPQLEVMRKT